MAWNYLKLKDLDFTNMQHEHISFSTPSQRMHRSFVSIKPPERIKLCKQYYNCVFATHYPKTNELHSLQLYKTINLCLSHFFFSLPQECKGTDCRGTDRYIMQISTLSRVLLNKYSCDYDIISNKALYI
jgi:hypothetical protein